MNEEEDGLVRTKKSWKFNVTINKFEYNDDNINEWEKMKNWKINYL
jgi:hypothetical protein